MKLKNLIRNKKGSNTIEAIIIAPVWLIILLFLIVWLTLISEQSRVNEYSNIISEEIGLLSFENFENRLTSDYYEPVHPFSEELEIKILEYKLDDEYKAGITRSDFRGGLFVKFQIKMPSSFKGNAFTITDSEGNRWSIVREYVYSIGVASIC